MLIQEPLKARIRFLVPDNTKRKIVSYAMHQTIRFHRNHKAASISVGTIVMSQCLVPVITVRKLALNERQSTQWDRKVHLKRKRPNLPFQDLETITWISIGTLATRK